MQRAVYSWHKRTHRMLYLTINTPVGLVLYMYSAVFRCRYDITPYRESELSNALQNILHIIDGQFYCYRDPDFSYGRA